LDAQDDPVVAEGRRRRQAATRRTGAGDGALEKAMAPSGAGSES
jgi:hypothetical protein